MTTTDRCAAGREITRDDCDWGVPCPHVGTIVLFIGGDEVTPPMQVMLCAWHENLLDASGLLSTLDTVVREVTRLRDLPEPPLSG